MGPEDETGMVGEYSQHWPHRDYISSYIMCAYASLPLHVRHVDQRAERAGGPLPGGMSACMFVRMCVGAYVLSSGPEVRDLEVCLQCLLHACSCVCVWARVCVWVRLGVGAFGCGCV